MTSATALRRIAGQRAAGTAKTMIERNCRGKRSEAGTETDAQVPECASTVTLKREDVLGTPEDRLNALTDRSQVRAAPRLVLAPGAHHCASSALICPSKSLPRKFLSPITTIS